MMMHVRTPTILKGAIANVQLDEDSNPTWIESGYWMLRLRPGATASDLPSAHLVVRISMVGIDGTAMHRHSITNFTLTNVSMEGNTTHIFEGTATVTMREGPVSGVPLTIKILNGAAVAMSIGPDMVDSHFGVNPVYGTLTESSRAAVASNIRENMSMNDRPSNATPRSNATTDIGLERSDVNYYGNATGYLVEPRGQTDNLPAVVVIHEWWGVNQQIKNAADELAKEGYVVLAADLYNGEVASEPDRARELSSSVGNNPEEAIDNLNAAVKYLASLPNVNSSRIASLGWCFGGGQSLQLALNTETPLSATVIYYGNLVTDQTELAKIRWPVLGIFGSEDQSIPVDTVNQFEAALNASNVTNKIYIYEGVGHAFANPSGDNYAPEETADAWEKTLAFLSTYV
jgi:carboxymethylenebutenolidase